ncbi:MAG: endospore germination permease [Firmicutes bacterium]|nr:endospore germination permease [Bacillota bacterium]
MEKQVSQEQVSIISYFLIRSCFMGLAMEMLVHIAKQDSIWGLLLGIAIGIIPFFLYNYLMNYREDFSIIELNKHIFGNKWGKIINSIIILFVFYLANIIFWNLLIFITSQYLYQSPTIFVSVIFIIPIFYLLTKGLKGIGRVGIILFIFAMILYWISFFGLISQVAPYNFKPFLTNGLVPIINSGYHYFAFSTLLLFLITIIPKNQIKEGKKIKLQKSWGIGLGIIHLFTFSALFFTIAVFGLKLTMLYQYPEFHLLKRVSIAGFLERIESFLSFRWIFDFFMSITFCLYFITEGIRRNFQIHSKKVILGLQITISLLLMFMANMTFTNSTTSNYFLTNYFPAFLVFFFLIIPSCTYFGILKKKKGTTS